MENKELKEKESMDTLELARECGARETFQVAVGVNGEDGYIFSESQLAEFESRIRADEREKAAKGEADGVFRGVDFQHGDSHALTHPSMN
jgi:hypothetical protein